MVQKLLQKLPCGFRFSRCAIEGSRVLQQYGNQPSLQALMVTPVMLGLSTHLRQQQWAGLLASDHCAAEDAISCQQHGRQCCLARLLCHIQLKPGMLPLRSAGVLLALVVAYDISSNAKS